MGELYISGRERKIVEVLLQARQAITMSQLGAELEVSSRTIHRDLKNIEEILSEYNLRLERKSGSGLEVFGHEDDKRSLLLNLNDVLHTDYTPEERQTVILLTLLETNEPVKLFNFVSELHVTMATVSNDLDKIEEELSEYQLSLIRRRGYGVKVTGNENDKRAMISRLIIDHLDEFDFYSMLKNNIQQKSKQDVDAISSRLLGIVDPDKLRIIEHEVERVRAVLPYGLADSAYIGLVVHLALAIERLKQGDVIQFDPVYLKELQNTKEYRIAHEMIKKLERAFKIEIPVDEIGYITMHLLGSKLRVDHDYLIEDSNLDIAYRAKRLIHFVGDALDEKLTDNHGLLNDLVAHLIPTIYRMKQDMKIKNPLIDDITRDYQALFQVIKKGVSEVFPDISFPEEEIGYLVLHFGSALLNSKVEVELTALVICPSGIGTAKMLAERLLQKIPEIKHVENKSLFDIDQTEIGNYDLIVSTIPLQGITNYILASPILTETDIHHITKVVRLRKLNRPIVKEDRKKITEHDIVHRLQTLQNYSKAMLDLLASFYIGIIGKNKAREEILASICSELEEKKVLDNQQLVFKDLIAREEIGGLGIPGTELALYHARSKGVVCISFSIYTLHTPVAILGMDGQEMKSKRILIMLAPKDTNPQMLEILSILSGLIIRDAESIKLFETANEANIMAVISEELNQFMNEKLT